MVVCGFDCSCCGDLCLRGENAAVTAVRLWLLLLVREW